MFVLDDILQAFRFGLKGESIPSGFVIIPELTRRIDNSLDIPVELYPMLVCVVAACVGGGYALARQRKFAPVQGVRGYRSGMMC